MHERAVYLGNAGLDDELITRGARRVTADADHGFPCRVSLQDASAGDELILVNYKHLDNNSPYDAAHAIYIRKDVIPKSAISDSLRIHKTVIF